MSKRRTDLAVPKLSDMYISAEAAAESLGVSQATFYSYVSRRGVRSEPVPGSKKRLYWVPDVETLRSSTTAGTAEPANREDQADGRTAITLNTDAGQFYRGKSAIELSRTETVESVAALLWQVDELAVFDNNQMVGGEPISGLRSRISHLPAADRISILYTLMEQVDLRAFDFAPTEYASTGARALRQFAAELAGSADPSPEPLHIALTQRLGAPMDWADVVRRLLILSADHGVTPSTWAVRVLASTGVTAYRVAITGLAASGGRGLPYGQLHGLSRMLEEMMKAKDPTNALISRMKEGEECPGFGSGIYPNGNDPRAVEMLSVLEATFSDDPDVKRFLEVKEIVQDKLDKAPDFALLTVFVCRILGLSPDDSVLARLGRMIGWIAHAMEALDQATIGPRRQFYSGLLPTLATR
ncbi:MAG: citrate/2-methylcitrate synthase [Pseudomonadota bacterium]|nr:citrate/2-methylcitrate synthase [Pseudomonadota bacterium]